MIKTVLNETFLESAIEDELEYELFSSMANSECAPSNVLKLPLAYSPSQRLRKVRNSRKPPFRLICKIFGANIDSDREEGTGFLVGNKHVLTAAHILLNRYNKIVKPSKVDIIPGDDDGFIPFEMSKAKKIHLFPGYKVGTQVCANDLALIETENFVTLNAPDPGPGIWGAVPNAVDNIGTSMGALKGWRPGRFNVNIAGYPSESEILRHSFDATLNIPNAKLLTLPTSKQNKFLFVRNDARRGMSGSPVWVKRHASNGGRIAFGIFLGMDAISGHRYAVVRLITTDVIRFIAKYTGKTIRQFA